MIRTDHTAIARIAATVLLLLLVVLRSTPALADTSDDSESLARTQHIISPSVVYLSVRWDASVETEQGWYNYVEGELNTSCSGVIVSPDGYIATAAHCVDDGPDSGVVQRARDITVQNYADEWGLPDGKTIDDLYDHAYGNWAVEGATDGAAPDREVAVALEPAAVGVPGGEELPARVVDVVSFEQGDVALLKINATNLTPAQVEPESNVAVGDTIMAVGYGAVTDSAADIALDPSFKDGRVSALRTSGGGLYTVIEHTADTLQGMSGGPLVDNDGNVVGITSFTVSDDANTSPFAGPASILREMLARAGAANELTDLDRQYRAGVEAFYAGDPLAAVTALEQVVDERPEHEQARDLLEQAEEVGAATKTEVGPATKTSAGGSTGSGARSGSAQSAAPPSLLTAPIIGLLVLTLVVGSTIAAGTVVLVSRRRQRAALARSHTTSPSPSPEPRTPADDGDRGSPGTNGLLQSDAGLTIVGHAAGTPSGAVGEPEAGGVGVRIRPDARHCGDCGEAARPQQRFCASCGSQLHA